jgi:hypothetical protein
MHVKYIYFFNKINHFFILFFGIVYINIIFGDLNNAFIAMRAFSKNM